ncbi:MAG: class I SAM-dependent methyltransferase, partial [Candidatus Thorarchaeota archaeon]
MRREVTGEKMSVRSYVQVPVSEGENVRRTLAERGLLDREHKPVVEGGSLLLPLVDGSLPTVKKLLQGTAGVVTGHRRFESTDRRSKTLAEALKEILTPSELELLPRAYDLIGNIAVLEIPEEIEHHEEVIGEAFISIHPNFTTVLAKKGAISGTKRTRKYRFLAGDKTTRTIHREYGCRFVVDLEQAYFSPRLLEEHNRVAGLTLDGECVIDMFCGVGPFSIHIAKSKRAKVIAVDINAAAISLLKESLKLNR